ncbi:EAL domain-containing protein [Williamsia maris]|uniref:Two-component system, chemotaxis family, CheB/CheR fusion protein n=1 Tax=Williamsia maris TaxID=72806 RepID=A0ABT1H8J8_9NOCA|nr:EAL domain-containing protein [Williamsia maris]MCP2174504.1 two-component system, chemotaxis family, CheB/CheR fusion protein [Williamsia maris]
MTSGHDPGTAHRRVIAVGSSAGGIEALSALLSTASVGRNECFVVAQHLSPTDTSVLPALLARVTSLQVTPATDGAPLASDVVYVTPPGMDVVVDGGVLRVAEPDEQGRPRPSIDRLFTSVGLTYGVDSVAILLSGTGDDGAAGVESVHSAGGFVVAQDPATASFAGMPGAAVATGTPDLVLSAGEMLPEMARVLDQASKRSSAPADTALGLDDSDLEQVITVLRDVTGVDFSGYKRSTLLRQIERRQRLVDLSTEDYLERVADDAIEANALSRNVLVSVTAFFRDAEVWDAVAEQLRTIAADLAAGEDLRIWVPGCASGEEAFTIAMLAAEAVHPRSTDHPLRIKVFATDLDERALAVARRGRYSDAAVATVPDHLRTRWMQRVGGEWEVTPALREALVIARHNVAYDPPFPRIAVISLRNTMIYFQNHLQERVLALCQFALVPGGLLVLGQSERIPRVDNMFSVVDPSHRLYRRANSARVQHLPNGRYVPPVFVQAPPVLPTGREPSSVLFRRLLATVAPPSLVLDDSDTVVEVVGDVSRWCAVSIGQHTGHVSDLIRDRYQVTVRTMLSQLRHSSPDSVTRVIAEPGGQRVEITAARLVGKGSGSVLSFHLLTQTASPDDDDREIPPLYSSTDDELILSGELRATQDALQSTIEDLSSSNEELQALNEELQASAEELQATSEEAQASNEELEATNEELTTLNSELQLRGNELVRVNVDLQNIQSSITSGLVIVDREMRVTRFTPLAVRLFSLINEDLGRPLPAVPTTIPVPDLRADLEATIRSRSANMRELTSEDRDLLVQIQPYVDSDGEVRGAIVVVTDVGDVAAERRGREAALANLNQVAESVREFVWQRTLTGELTMVTSRVEQLYGLDRAAVLEDPELLLAAVHPDDRHRVQTALASADRQWQIEYRIIRPDGAVRWIAESAQFAPGNGAEPDHVVGSSLDITERRELRQLADRRSAVLDAVLRTEDMGVLVLDADDRVLSANAGVSALTGYTSSFLIGTPITVLLEPDPAGRAESDGPDTDVPRRIVTADGVARPVTVELQTVAVEGEGQRDGPRTIALVRDISRMREITTELAKREQYDLQTGLLTRGYLRSKTEELMASGANSVALLWIDLDGFKEINDRFGHRAGDLVLATIATRLHQAARRHDIVGRLGGDEFALLVTRSRDLHGLDSLALRVLAAIREPIPLQDSLAYVSASVGIAVHPQDAATADGLLHNADTAMYVAKDRGRDRHAYFAQEMNAAADERAAMRQRLSAALSRNEFEMHYQPVVDLVDGRAVMVEALVRWRRDGEVVSAADFIEYAAETGQMRALGRIVLQLVDADITALHAALGDRQPSVAVNLSVTELDERDITDWLLAWQPAGGLGKIVAEVTESVLLGPDSRALDTLGLLRRLGATISIDDFGTGYSNLELLDRLEPGIIKVDRSLLRRAQEDDRGMNILDAAVQLAHALDAKVVLEGVEDEEMLAIAGEKQADLAQGYHIARPMPLAEIIDWIAQRP